MANFTGTPRGSLQYDDQQTAQMADPVIGRGKLECMPFKYTHTATEGAGVGEINIVTLPAGLIRVFSDLSRIVSSAMVSTANLSIGYRAHTKMDGTAVVEDDNAFENDADAGSAIDKVWTLPAVGFLDLDSENGVVLFVEIDTANIEDTDTIDGYVVYSQGG